GSRDVRDDHGRRPGVRRSAVGLGERCGGVQEGERRVDGDTQARGLAQVATSADAGNEPASRASRTAPTQRRGEVLLLLGPAVLYLVAFSIYPLVVSLVRSFQDYNSQADTWRWIGLGNYRELVTSNEFWSTVEHTLVLTFAGVAIQVVLGTALALFFNQQLR